MSLLSRAGTILAATTVKVEPGRYGYKDPLGYTDVPHLIGGIIRFSLGVVGAVFLLMFIYGGFLWLTAGGEADRVKKARHTLVNAVLGLAIIFLSYTIVSFIITMSGRIQGSSLG